MTWSRSSLNSACRKKHVGPRHWIHDVLESGRYTGPILPSDTIIKITGASIGPNPTRRKKRQSGRRLGMNEAPDIGPTNFYNVRFGPDSAPINGPEPALVLAVATSQLGLARDCNSGIWARFDTNEMGSSCLTFGRNTADTRLQHSRVRWLPGRRHDASKVADIQRTVSRSLHAGHPAIFCIHMWRGWKAEPNTSVGRIRVPYAEENNVGFSC